VDRVIIHVGSRSSLGLRTLKPFFPELSITELARQLDHGLLRVCRDLDGPTAVDSVRFLLELSEALWTPGVSARVHHLVSEDEDEQDPLTEIDLVLLGWALELTAKRLRIWYDVSDEPSPAVKPVRDSAGLSRHQSLKGRRGRGQSRAAPRT
jgi:hypothetical protein